MEKLNLKKNDILIKGINAIADNYCSENNIEKANVLKIQLVCEEFLTNILFPNFVDEVEFLISKQDSDIVISFSYEGENYMNKINDAAFLALKLLKNKTKDIITETKDNKTTVQFVI